MFLAFARKSAPFPTVTEFEDRIEVEIRYYRYTPRQKPFLLRIPYIGFCFLCGLAAVQYVHTHYSNMLGLLIFAALALAFWTGCILGLWATRLFDTVIYSFLGRLRVTFTAQSIQIRGGTGLVQAIFGRTVPLASVTTFQAVNGVDVDNTTDPRNLFAPETAIVMVSGMGAPSVLCINSMPLAQNTAIIAPLNNCLAAVKRALAR